MQIFAPNQGHNLMLWKSISLTTHCIFKKSISIITHCMNLRPKTQDCNGTKIVM